MRSLPSRLDPNFTVSPQFIDGQNATETFTLSYDGEDREITFSGTILAGMEYQPIEGRTLTATGCNYVTQIRGLSFETVLHLAGNETYEPATATIGARDISSQRRIDDI